MYSILFAVETAISDATVSATSQLVQSGVLGSVCVLLMTALIKIWWDAKADAKDCEAKAAAVTLRYEDERAATALRHGAEMKAVQDQRVADHVAMTATLLRTTEQSVASLTTSANGLEAVREALIRLETRK